MSTELLIALLGIGGSALTAYLVVRITQAGHEERIKVLESEVKLLRERWHSIVGQTQKVVGDMFQRIRRHEEDDDGRP